MYEDEYKRIFSKNLNKYMEINGKNQIDIIMNRNGLITTNPS